LVIAGLIGLGAALGVSGSAVVRAPADFRIYYAATRVLLAGGNPYDWHALRHVVASVPAPGYVYPLWGLFVILPLAWLPLPLASGIWLMFNLACLALALTLLARVSGLALRSYWLPGLFMLTCCSVPGVFALLQGQIALPLLVATVGAFRAAQRGHGGWAGALIALALLKPQLTWLPALVVLAVAWRRGQGRQALVVTAGLTVALLGLSFLLRYGWLGGWLTTLGQDAGQGGTGTRALWANMGTAPALAAHLPAPLGALVLLLAGAAGLGLLWWCGVRALGARAAGGPAPNTDELALLAAAIVVATVLSPWMWIYDGVFWLVLVVGANARGPAWRRWASLATFWGVPWAIRLLHLAATRAGGTSLNKLEDVVVAPLLLALLLAGPDIWLSLRAARESVATLAGKIRPATPPAQRS
jgi:hypothetical protein